MLAEKDWQIVVLRGEFSVEDFGCQIASSPDLATARTGDCFADWY